MSAVRDHDQRIVNAVRWLGVAELSTERMVASVSTNDDDLVMQYEKAVAEGLQRMDATHKEIAARPTSAQSATTLHKLSTQQTELLALLAKASAMSNSGDVGGLRTLVTQTFQPAITRYLQLRKDFATRQEAERDAVVAQAQALRKTIGFMVFASALILLLTASGIVVAITRSISHPLQYAVQVAEDIARGRLAQAVVSDRRDEFGRLLQALERMATQLHRVVSEVRSGIDSVSLAYPSRPISSRSMLRWRQRSPARKVGLRRRGGGGAQSGTTLCRRGERDWHADSDLG